MLFSILMRIYVEKGNLLFSLPDAAMSFITERETALVPENLTSQFKDRANRQEAIDSWKARQKAITNLFPSGNTIKLLLQRGHYLKKQCPSITMKCC